MQSVSDAFSVEEVDTVRKVAQSVQVSWKKDFQPSITFFTIGVSTIGGNDIIPGAAGVQSAWNRYTYQDESERVLDIDYERALNMPLGGLTKALADVRLDNTGILDYGYSLSLDGSDYVQKSTETAYNLGAYSVSLWVKAASGQSDDRIFAEGSSSSNNPIFTIGVDTTTQNKVKVFIRNDANTTLKSASSNTTFFDSSWHHVVWTDDNGSAELYIDGVEDTQSFGYTRSGTLTLNRTAVGALVRASASNFIAGNIDEVRVFNTTLTQQQVTDLYLHRTIPSGSVLTYLFDEGSGLVAKDSSGSGNGTIVGGVYSTDTPGFAVGMKSGRYTPRYAGGDSELFTAVLPRRPMIINAGFDVGGAEITIPQFVGITDKAVKLDARQKTAELSAVDFINFLQNKSMDRMSMFTSQPSDVVIEDLLIEAGLATSQYELDDGLNIIKFGLFEQGSKFSDIIHEISQAENAHFYQDEEGRLRFENRHHWTNSPHNQVQRIIATSQVINQILPNTDHLINVVEVKASPREVQDAQLVWRATDGGGGVKELLASSDTEIWANYDDPMFLVTTPVPNGTAGQTSYFIANTASDGTGSDITASVSLKSIENFAQASKLVFTNSTGSSAFLTTLDIWGRPARKTGDIYIRSGDDSSITAYEERVQIIENKYIQDVSWAQTYASLLLASFSEPENLQELTIRAIPELQLGDLISWQGHYWTIYGIKSKINPGEGFIQELKLLQRTQQTFFRIGISTIGGQDVIAP